MIANVIKAIGGWLVEADEEEAELLIEGLVKILVDPCQWEHLGIILLPSSIITSDTVSEINIRIDAEHNSAIQLLLRACANHLVTMLKEGAEGEP